VSCPGYTACANLAARGVLVCLIPGQMDGAPTVSAVFGVPTPAQLAEYAHLTTYQRAAFLLGATTVAHDTAQAHGLVTH
jgi:hypothetical protein